MSTKGELINGMMSQSKSPAPKPKAKPVVEAQPREDIKKETK